MEAGNTKTALVTGSTDGLGRGVARELARRGYAVILHGRSEARCEEAAAELPGGAAGYLVADLSSLGEVRKMAREVLAGRERLDLLVNNAGVISRERRESREGFELTFAVNYLSHFLLTLLLLPLLRRSAPARVVNVASAAQSPIDFEDPMMERSYSPMEAYARSKLAQVMFSFALAGRLSGTGVCVNALHPASLMDTKMVRESFGRPMSSVEEGVRAVVRLAASSELEGVSGRYFEGTREARAHPQAYDPAARERLWELSEGLCGALDAGR
ncbi:short-chain dehydrogenase/reductase SDR [Rubrobacter xylanophilus DSM 9941]|uniref:Short-chain dehydrogenase/reductase SDR n=1 Tax=Rubrobacter xylanophilus (strain DSM 9941 / JCM 11954 / NBRC 16129 / PRD-1) TaxID=266117 RepID=Q1AZ78_RUBXD|nr:SDR family NAD(P)-dependent oxidoreductase [Rubrobacter xylanophilus]ABG03300.1 short-chain dehydrogenase/reductase SDR [Rubrobacter xylanophilus DSM 9941]